MSNQAFDAYDECVEKLEKAEAERDEARAERDQAFQDEMDADRRALAYREALERIAELSGGGEYAAEIARQALADQEQERHGEPSAREVRESLDRYFNQGHR